MYGYGNRHQLGRVFELVRYGQILHIEAAERIKRQNRQIKSQFFQLRGLEKEESLSYLSSSKNLTEIFK